MMKKKLITLTIILVIFLGTLIFTSGVEAIDLTTKLATVGSKSGFTSSATLSQQIGKIISIALSLLGIIFMILIIYAGYLWMIARGNEEEITKAKTIFRGSIIGLIIVLTAYAISAFVITKLTAATGLTP